ncbi:carbohydrate ABC transporter permease [Paenibacillus chitinolyticus]|uniref:Carbohydrate ABC transporter permease n=1 Tax=Paenibacillus chitinolyticus TaxID=79263 RepID=A0A410WWT1_9BACL|nr:carbohydrate ABC transporter permease [Paenibacillus chitinolyticus]MCY9593238.1 carbohydrate ABC transporter permease [Paenibacillus chitinolyticus]MCY9597704.1 carbohydrate ABC transporter permease [Paenibacillus chitinolyticus]QAV18691.1 carbohydrate ABC transporter permease [Paenibacillus chitinolyticus]
MNTIQSTREKAFDWAVYALLTIVSLIVLYPLVFVLVASFSSPEAVMRGEVWLWPKDITWMGYTKIFQNNEILTGYLNTIVYTVVGTAINLILSVAAAYPLSRKDFAGRNAISALMVFTMFFSGGMVPTYLLVKNLSMLNTMWALVIPGAVSVYNIIIMRTFFQSSIPGEMQEAASIDGCSNLGILWKIVLPLSMPIIAVMILFYSVGHWNSYFSGLMYLTDRDKYPLQLFLREILIQGQMQEMLGVGDDSHARNVMEGEAIKYAVVIVANLPVLMLYPFLQRYFVKGVMIGSVKG